MAKSAAQKQADYRERMRATHARIIVYVPRPAAARIAQQCLQTGLTMSELVTAALTQYEQKPQIAADSDVARHTVTSASQQSTSRSKK